MVEKRFYVYIMASERNGTLYIGVTSDLVKRIYEHKVGAVEGFTKEYAVKCLFITGYLTRRKQRLFGKNK